MDDKRLLAFTASVVLTFVWTQWKRTSNPATRTIGVVVIMGAFVIFALLTN